MFIRNKAPPYVRELLKQYKYWDIRDLMICRNPINSAIYTAMNLMSLGKLDKNIQNKDYDKLYHLFMLITIGKKDKTRTFILEKNDVVNFERLKSNTVKSKSKDCIKVNLPNVNFGTFYKNAENFQPRDFYLYDAKKNNCQVFVASFIIGNNLTAVNNENLISFVVQDVDDLLIKPLWKITNKVTDVAAAFNKLIYGSGI